MKIIKITALMVALLAATNVHANKFGVRVVSESGEPEEGVAVCIGTHGNYKQFGSHFTSRNGDVVIDVPNVPLVVTISKSRFTGIRMTEPARYFNLVKEVKLVEGLPGPRCRGESSLAGGITGKDLTITGVAVDKQQSKTSLQTSIIGKATHYRVSADKTFAGARWQAFSQNIALNSRMAQKQEVYLQVRRYAATKNASLEARSPVVTVALPQS